jgi:hypothetical protein
MPIDPLRRSAPAPHAAAFAPMGLRLRVASNDEAVLAAARDSFGGYGPLSPGEPDAPPELTIELLVHELASPAPLAPPVYRARGHLVYAALGPAGTAVLDLRAGLAFGFIAPELAADPIALRVYLLEALLYTFLQQHPLGGRADHGFVGIHAACVLPPGGSALMLRAHSGGGKSVLAYACLQRGFGLLAEDVTWLELRAGALAALWGAPWLLHLRPGAAQLFPELASQPSYRRPTGVAKIALAIPELFPRALVTQAPPGTLCFLQRHGGRASRLERIADPALVRALFEATEGEEVDAPRYSAGCAALLARPACILHAGSDLDGAVRALALI